VAGSYFRGHSGSHTLQPTALVHEAFLRLAQSAAVPTADRAHFVAIAATAMRQILIDHARRHAADKRGGGMTRVTLDPEQAGAGDAAEAIEVLALDAALTRLAALSAQQARIIELQYFGGLTVDEVADALALSRTTVEREWRRARAWLRGALSEPGDIA
jgi:RNA polymerase sigma factor (TIGR02999 family)